MTCFTISINKKNHLSLNRSILFIVTCAAALLCIGACSSDSASKEKIAGEIEIEEDRSYGRAMGFGPLKNKEINEASGLAVYKGSQNLFWTHNDSWDDARIFLIQKNGRSRGEYRLQGTANRDWEDLAAGPGPEPEANYLYIGDIGDNFTLYSDYTIYRIQQPPVPSGSEEDQLSMELSGAEALRFTYPDGSHDAETLFMDPLSRDLYIVTKQEKQDRVYRYPYPQSVAATDTVEFIGTLPFNQFTSGDMSPDGRTLLLKTLKRVFIWRRDPGQSISDLLSEKPKEVLPYGTGPQEEAITVGPDGRGFYTLSESKGKPVQLYFHPPKSKKE